MEKIELYGTFVAREKLLSELLETIDDNTEKKSIQHIILLGARGIGKTNMLRMVENKVLDSPQLRGNWITVNFPEEQYGILGLLDFFKYILGIILQSSQLEKIYKDDYKKELENVDSSRNKESLDKLISIFKDISNKENKQFLLLIDNIDKILAEKITEEKELEYLRSILMTDNFLMILGTSTSIFEEIALYDKAFFRFFKTIHLQNLSDKEVEALLLKRAKFDGIVDKIKLDENKNKIKAITDLTGGYPRLVLMLYEILEDKPLLDVLKTFNKLLDNLTPYYKHRMDDLAPQQQKIIDIIMLSDGVASPTEVANKVGWKPTIITSQFKRLKDTNILQVKELLLKKKKKILYEISDRLFVIWYQMRYLGGISRRRIEYIVTFLKIWYDIEALKDKISLYASHYQQNYSAGNFSESYDYARSISIISCAIPDATEKEKIHFEQIVRYTTLRKFEDALREQKELLKTHEEEGNKKGLAIDYGNLGIIYQLQGSQQKALEHYEKALKRHEEIENGGVMALYYTNMGVIYRLQGQLQKALERYEKALKIYRELGDKKYMAVLLTDIGIIYGTQRDLQKALECFEEALTIDEEIGDKQGIAAFYGNKGIVHEMQNDLQKALEYYEKALEIQEAIEDKRGMASVYCNMGNVYRKKGELDKALEYLEKGRIMHEEIGNKQGIAAAYGNEGITYKIQGNLEKAMKHYNISLKIFKEIGNHLDYIIIMNTKIGLLFELAIKNNLEKNTGKALDNIKEIAESLKETKNEETIRIIMSSISELLIDSEYDLAITSLEKIQEGDKDIFEICEPFLISAQYLKTKDSSILENTSSIVLEGVNKILEAIEKQKLERVNV